MRIFLIISWLINIRISLFIKCVKNTIQNAEFKTKSFRISLQLPNGSYSYLLPQRRRDRREIVVVCSTETAQYQRHVLSCSRFNPYIIRTSACGQFESLPTVWHINLPAQAQTHTLFVVVPT